MKKIGQEEAVEYLDACIKSCEEGQDGVWDVTTKEGQEGFEDMRYLLEQVRDFITKPN